MVRTYFRVGVAVFAAFVMAACSDGPTLTEPFGAVRTLVPIPNDDNLFLPVAGQVKVCRFDGGGTFTTSQNPAGGGTSIEANTDLSSAECSVVWLSNGALGPFDVTVSQTGPLGFRLYRLSVLHTNSSLNQNYEDPNGCAGTENIPTSATTTVGGDAGAVFYFKQCTPIPPPPPPPSGCNGLTPGFWKNWSNHFTAAQFALLIDGTAFPNLTNAQATSILSANNPAYNRLYKFVLANQLTMSLTNMPDGFPNKSKGAMSGSCEVNGKDMAAAMALALDMLANPGNYTTAQLNAMGTLMDAFANMND